jgi:hypothetical protein
MMMRREVEHWQRRRERRGLEREADRILAADRRRQRRARKPKKPAPARADAAMPRRLTLADLGTLRQKGLVP